MSTTSASGADWPFISVVIPALNEERFIEKCLRSVIVSGYAPGRYEIIVADGGSADATHEVVARVSAEHPFVRLVDNPKRFQASGVNVGARQADPKAEYIVRLDAHAEYPQDFLRQLLRTALDTRAELVVYANEPHAVGCFQKGVAFAFAHRLGVGNSHYRLGNTSGWVDHGQHGCFQRAVWDRLEGYDETMSPNEDAELSYRITQEGGRVYLNHHLRMRYYPRSTPWALARQYFRYGLGRARNLLKHRARPKLRQMAPPLWVLAECALLAASFYDARVLLVPLAYVAVLVLVSVLGAIEKRSPCVLMAAPAFWIMHHAWAAGVIYECLRPATWANMRREASS